MGFEVQCVQENGKSELTTSETKVTSKCKLVVVGGGCRRGDGGGDGEKGMEKRVVVEVACPR